MSSSFANVSRSKLALLVLLLAASPAVLGTAVEVDDRDFAIHEPRALEARAGRLTGIISKARTAASVLRGPPRVATAQRARVPAKQRLQSALSTVQRVATKGSALAGSIGLAASGVVNSGLLTGGRGVGGGGLAPPLAVAPPLGQIDPTTGLPFDPNAPLPADPSLGFADPNAGLGPDPNAALGAAPLPPAAAPLAPAAAGAPVFARSFDYEWDLERREPEPEPLFGASKIAQKAAQFALSKAPGFLKKAKTVFKSVATKTSAALVGGAALAAPLAIPPPVAAPLAPAATLPADPAVAAGLPADPTVAAGSPVDPATGLPVDPTTGLPLAARSIEHKSEVDRRCVAPRGTAGAQAYARCLESLNDLD